MRDEKRIGDDMVGEILQTVFIFILQNLMVRMVIPDELPCGQNYIYVCLIEQNL